MDLVFLNTASILLKHQVIKYGKLIYCADEESRVNFVVKMINEFVDTQPLREFGWKGLVKSVKEGGFGEPSKDYKETIEKLKKLHRQIEAAKEDEF